MTCGREADTVAAIPTLAAGDLIIWLPCRQAREGGGGGFHLLEFSLQYSAHGLPDSAPETRRQQRGAHKLFHLKFRGTEIFSLTLLHSHTENLCLLSQLPGIPWAIDHLGTEEHIEERRKLLVKYNVYFGESSFEVVHFKKNGWEKHQTI